MDRDSYFLTKYPPKKMGHAPIDRILARFGLVRESVLRRQLEENDDLRRECNQLFYRVETERLRGDRLQGLTSKMNQEDEAFHCTASLTMVFDVVPHG